MATHRLLSLFLEAMATHQLPALSLEALATHRLPLESINSAKRYHQSTYASEVLIASSCIMPPEPDPSSNGGDRLSNR